MKLDLHDYYYDDKSSFKMFDDIVDTLHLQPTKSHRDPFNHFRYQMFDHNIMTKYRRDHILLSNPYYLSKKEIFTFIDEHMDCSLLILSKKLSYYYPGVTYLLITGKRKCIGEMIANAEAGDLFLQLLKASDTDKMCLAYRDICHLNLPALEEGLKYELDQRYGDLNID